MHPEVGWGAQMVAQRLYISESEASELLTQLSAQGFLITMETQPTLLYCDHPRLSELELMMGRIADMYARYLVSITHLIHSKPKTKIQKLADAFKLRKN